MLVAYTVNELTGQRSPIHPQGSQLNADGTVTYPDGSVALTDGSVKHPDGSVTKPDGLRVYANGDTFNDTTGVYTFADGVISQAVKNSSGVWEYPDAKNPGESKGDAVAPPESSAKEPDASTTLSDPLHTYGDGDTFNKVTGVFTYKHGATVQYVRDSNGEWMLPDPQ
ncbi:hypothetical protein AQS70_14815 [Pseudomonas endophytica]|uniref:Uncharacterized protein n=1 Tax=Pseudomonas endophytica TaxID=1563157 RepID=A0A0Q1CD79_9PSED|nr:hypothetical protein AQS70_14815 [Pseudomonas endophytica]